MLRARSAIAWCLLLLGVGCAGTHVPPPRPPVATLQAAAEEYARYDLAGSRRLYGEVLADPQASPADRESAALALAHDAWVFDHDAVSARKLLDAALVHAVHPSAVLVARGQVTLDSGAPSEAVADAERALAVAREPGPRSEATLLFARVAAALHPPGAAVDPSAAPMLRRAAALLVAFLDRQPGQPEASALLLGVGLALGDGPLAFDGWRSYFFVAEDSAVPSVLAHAYAVLRAQLPGWHGQALEDADRRALVTALAESRFHDLALQLAAGLPADPKLTELAAYQHFIEALTAVNGDFYPRIAKGLKHYEDAYDAAIATPSRALWAVLAPGKPYDDEAFFARLRERFGTEGYVGTTVNYYGLLLGHIIQDDKRTIEQYGYRSEFRLVSIDRMISRDFTSWYGTTNVGGWGTESTMFQVRAAYVQAPFQRLSWVTDPSARAAFEADLARLTADDLRRCRADRYAEPASLSRRIQLHASDRLWAELGRRGLKGRARALAFVSESLRLNVEATVFAHEGRHALDQRAFKSQFDRMGDGERELRAKLSEVAFASAPMLALTGSIFGGNLDDSSGHGKANHRIRILLVDWMTRHAREIAGLDPSRPLIMQVDRLTDAQLLSVIRSADPLAQPPRSRTSVR